MSAHNILRHRGLSTAAELAPLMERWLRATHALAKARKHQNAGRPQGARFTPGGWSRCNWAQKANPKKKGRTL